MFMKSIDKQTDKTRDQRMNDQNMQNGPRQEADQKNDLTKKDIPESTNVYKGTMGSGQRQDTN
jgi:hypothetical protein